MRLKLKRKLPVQVLSRREAIRYCEQRHRGESVIISISDPNMVYDAEPFCSPENRVTAILPLCFSDADRPGIDVYGLEVEERDLMRDEDARKAVRFVRANRNKLILVHCDAGISRSAGVAAAIAEYYDGDARRFFESGQYTPNRWCYSKMMSAFLED